MNSDTTLKIFSIFNDLETGGYPDFMNYSVFKHLLSIPASFLSKLHDEVLQLRPTMDLVNLVCTINGALCYTATKTLNINDAIAIFDNQENFDVFVRKHFQKIIKVILSKNNNPTIPQRALSIARAIPFGTNVGILELGCSRGDIGLVLLNLDRVIGARDKYFFDDFNQAVSLGDFKPSYSINKYFGVDIDITIDDEWLLALWGLKDARRNKLQHFYSDFKPLDTDKFRRIRTDACDFNAYENEIKGFFGSEKILIILTSFMLYQLPSTKRKDLVKVVRDIREAFLSVTKSREVLWLDQGTPTENLLSDDFKFSECFVSKLWFENHSLIGQSLMQLRNDACEGWELLNSKPSVLLRDI